MRLTRLILILLILALAGCGEEPPPPKPPPPAPKPSVEAPTVSAAREAVWPTPGDVEIQEFDPVPTRTNIVAVLDMSGSMKDADCAGSFASKADAARAALAAWLKSVPEDANLGLVTFAGDRVSLSLPLGVDNRDTFRMAVNAVRPSGRTPLRTALAMAHQELERRARYQQGYGEYRIVVITDGAHSEGEDPRPVVDAILDNPANPVTIYTIGFCIRTSALNQPGRTVYQSAMNPVKEFENHAN
jgi:Ca-activated chloride channel family protein